MLGLPLLQVCLEWSLSPGLRWN